MKKLISVVTVCHNEENSISSTIYSVINQTFKNIEYIVVDGESVDRTPDIIKSFSKYIDIFISHPPNGIYNAMNLALSLASGEYIYFLNSGDLFFDNDVINKIYSVNVYGDIILGNYYKKGIDGRIKRSKNASFINKFNLLRQNINHQSFFSRRKLLLECGGFDERLTICADQDFLYKALFEFNASVQYFNNDISIYDMQGMSSNTKNIHRLLKEQKEIQRKYLPKSLFKISLLKYFLLSNMHSFFLRNSLHMLKRLLLIFAYSEHYYKKFFIKKYY